MHLLWNLLVCFRPEPSRCDTHLNGRFAHSIESITACFCGRALFHQVTQDGCCRENSEVDVIQRLALLECRKVVQGSKELSLPSGFLLQVNATQHTGTIYLERISVAYTRSHVPELTSHEEVMSGKKSIVDEMKTM
jgi:hypothetical protein